MTPPEQLWRSSGPGWEEEEEEECSPCAAESLSGSFQAVWFPGKSPSEAAWRAGLQEILLPSVLHPCLRRAAPADSLHPSPAERHRRRVGEREGRRRRRRERERGGGKRIISEEYVPLTDLHQIDAEDRVKSRFTPFGRF